MEMEIVFGMSDLTKAAVIDTAHQGHRLFWCLHSLLEGTRQALRLQGNQPAADWSVHFSCH